MFLSTLVCQIFCVFLLFSNANVILTNDTNKECDQQISNFVDELWTLHPRGEGQLQTILTNDIRRFWNVSSPHYPSKQEIISILHHGISPYAGLISRTDVETMNHRSSSMKYKTTLHNWLRIQLLPNRVRFLIEVGTFLGSGMVNVWAPIVSDGGVALCVDTWLGDINMRLGSGFQKLMSLQHGHPTLYAKFLNRVAFLNLTDTVFPLPMPSLVGARLLATLNWIVDVVYLDSAHEIGETFAELSLYFQLIRKGGVLIGDDYIDFPAVKHDVDLFVHYKSKFLKFEIIDSQQWGIIKLA